MYSTVLNNLYNSWKTRNVFLNITYIKAQTVLC